MSGPNPAIGSVPCPVAGCGEACEIKKFRHTATRDTGKRLAGRLYIDCPTHGRLGFDGRQAMQDYILEKGTIWGEHERAPASEPAAKPAPAPIAAPAPSAKPQPQPAAKPAPKKSGGWGFFQ